MSDTQPLVSVVTPSLNQAAYLPSCIESVAAQRYPRIEHIIVDGGSTDETLDILRSAPSSIRWISEPDKGQSDALNKGFAMAGGEIFGWLNADDLYYPNAAQDAVERLVADPNTGMIYGSGNLIDQTGNLLETIRPPQFARHRLLRRGNFLLQPAVFFRRDVFEQVGGIDVRYHYGMDYDLWLRMSAESGVEQVDAVLAALRMHEASKTTSSFRAFSREGRVISRRNGGGRFSMLWLGAPMGLAFRRWPLVYQPYAAVRNRIRMRRSAT